MKKLIVTTDDYGIVPSINKAIIDAINKNKVNSVAAFSNYDGSRKYKSAMANAKILLEKTNGNVDLGCHLTITSGQPITGDKAKAWCDEDGYFRSFSEFQRVKDLEALRVELHAQIDRFKDNNIPINHLSSHHNALSLFPEIFDVYLKVAKDKKLAIRSPYPRPSKRYNKYLKVLSFLLMDGDLNRKDRKEMRHFFKNMGAFLEKKSRSKLQTTDYFDSRHYGPLPMVEIRRSNTEKYILQKNKDLKKMINELRRSSFDSMEIVLHVCKDRLENFARYKDLDYPGISPKYFDSRILEFLSIMNFDLDQFPDVELASWGKLKRRGKVIA